MEAVTNNHQTIINPSDLSDLYFTKTSSTASKNTSNYNHCSYVNPDIKIARSKLHGRGLFAKQDIEAGVCLFVTPAIVHVDPMKFRRIILGEDDGIERGSGDLEKVAMELLLEEMKDVVEKADAKSSVDGGNVYIGQLNALLELVGSSSLNEELLLSDEGCNDDGQNECMVASDQLVETLLGNHVQCGKWNDSDDNSSRMLASDDELRRIILKNAFGPDFISYSQMQQYWEYAGDSTEEKTSPLFQIPHILGMFPLAAIINHSCVANAVRSYADGDIMIAHASSLIKKGQEITWTYFPPTTSLIDRRRALKRRHGFVCKCDRCIFESSNLKNDMLPINIKSYITAAKKWNLSLSSTELTSESKNLCIAFSNMEDYVYGSTFSNEFKRSLRISNTKLHFNYFNAALLVAGSNLDFKESILKSAMQLHFSFISMGAQASTEHLSLLHLCYDLANDIYREKQSMQPIKFWTDQLKRTHMIRYGDLGKNLENVRKVMSHTKGILRQKDGYRKAIYCFL